jgi:hypothetical protein
VSPITIAAKGIPTPMPIFAPLDNPFGLGVVVGVFVAVDVGIEVGTEVDCIGVLDVCEVMEKLVEVSVAAENALRSELCHHTGISPPHIL